MENEVFKLIATQGAFALLFSYLLFYVLKENSKREKNYQQLIEKLSKYLPVIDNNLKELEKKITSK